MILYTRKHQVPFQIDEEQFEKVSEYNWCISGNGYPCRSTGRKSGPPRIIFLHLFLFGHAPKGLEWDHINRDKLDNRRENLRQVVRVVNSRNRGLDSNNTSSVRGVSKQRDKWRVRISIGNFTRIHIGYYDTLEKATQARNDAETKFWGDAR